MALLHQIRRPPSSRIERSMCCLQHVAHLPARCGSAASCLLRSPVVYQEPKTWHYRFENKILPLAIIEHFFGHRKAPGIIWEDDFDPIKPETLALIVTIVCTISQFSLLNVLTWIRSNTASKNGQTALIRHRTSMMRHRALGTLPIYRTSKRGAKRMNVLLQTSADFGSQREGKSLLVCPCLCAESYVSEHMRISSQNRGPADMSMMMKRSDYVQICRDGQERLIARLRMMMTKMNI